MSGIRDYSISYFLPEIQDELVGYVSREAVDGTLRLIATLQKRDFEFSELQKVQASKKKFERIELENVFEVLYECSAIGHIERHNDGKNHFAFKFRNRHSNLNPGKRIIIHRGIWKAMNLG